MKINYLHKSCCVFLSFLVLFSTVSFTVEKHFCGDTLVDVAIFTKAQKCSAEMAANATTKITQKNCCKDEINVVQGVDKLTIKSLENLITDSYTIPVILTINTPFLEVLPQEYVPHKNYSPPNLIEDFSILFETFLI